MQGISWHAEHVDKVLLSGQTGAFSGESAFIRSVRLTVIDIRYEREASFSAGLSPTTHSSRNSRHSERDAKHDRHVVLSRAADGHHLQPALDEEIRVAETEG